MNTNKQNKTEYGSQNFESLKCSFLDDNDDILLDNSSDPGLNLFSENIKNLDTIICYQANCTIFLTIL